MAAQITDLQSAQKLQHTRVPADQPKKIPVKVQKSDPNKAQNNVSDIKKYEVIETRSNELEKKIKQEDLAYRYKLAQKKSRFNLKHKYDLSRMRKKLDKKRELKLALEENILDTEQVGRFRLDTLARNGLRASKSALQKLDTGLQRVENINKTAQQFVRDGKDTGQSLQSFVNNVSDNLGSYRKYLFSGSVTLLSILAGGAFYLKKSPGTIGQFLPYLCAVPALIGGLQMTQTYLKDQSLEAKEKQNKEQKT